MTASLTLRSETPLQLQTIMGVIEIESQYAWSQGQVFDGRRGG
jgi:hypothetical protein